MAIYAVGDIQGCYEPLVRLLDKVNFDTSQDRLWAVGDLVNRGPQSLETLRFLKSLGSSFTAVLGNHDLHLLAMASGAYQRGKKETLLALLDAPDCDELCQWLKHFPLVYQEEVDTERGSIQFVMVHAGFALGWTVEDALAYSKEVELALQGEQCFTFLASMYGNEPDIWSSALSGVERLRLITNILTRIRFCDAQGRLNFSAKNSLESAPDGCKPWYEFHTVQANTEILFGHWAALQGTTHKPNIHALDTGCVWGRCLSALNLQKNTLTTIDCHS